MFKSAKCFEKVSDKLQMLRVLGKDQKSLLSAYELVTFYSGLSSIASGWFMHHNPSFLGVSSDVPLKHVLEVRDTV